MTTSGNMALTLFATFVVAAMLAASAQGATIQMGMDAARTNSATLVGGFTAAPPVRWTFDSGNHEKYGRLSYPALSDVDGDGMLETFVASGDGRLFALDGDGSVDWTYSTGKEWLFAPPSVGDVDGDGLAEVVFGGYWTSGRGDSSVYAVNAEDGSLVWKFDTQRGIYLAGIEANPTLLDVNADGALDVLIPSDNYRFHILDGLTGQPLFVQPFEHFMRSSVPVGDVDLDGRLEFLVADNHALTRLYEVSESGIVLEWQRYTTYCSTSTPLFAQLDADPELEIAIFNVGWDGKPQYPGAAMVLEHDGSTKWMDTTHNMYYASPVAIDADGDGDLDLASVTYYTAKLVAFDGATGAVLWSRQMPGTYYGSTPLAVDIDGDGAMELLVSAKPDLLSIDASTGETEWTYSTSGVDPGAPMVADLEGDGSPEILFTQGPGILVCLGVEPPVVASVDFDPDTVNLKRMGRFVTVYVEFDEGYAPADAVISSITLNGAVRALSSPTAIGDHDRDGIPDLMVKFLSEEMKQTLSPGASVEITIEGQFADGRAFSGVDHIKVI